MVSSSCIIYVIESLIAMIHLYMWMLQQTVVVRAYTFDGRRVWIDIDNIVMTADICKSLEYL